MASVVECIEAARRARQSAACAASSEAFEAHLMRAERYADRAWSINEAEEGDAPLADQVWTFVH